MAEIPFERLEKDDKAARVRWANIKLGDTCQPVPWNGAGDRTVQTFDTFSGATITVQGTLGDDTDSYAQLTDPFGNAISFTGLGIDTITEMVRYIKPVIAGGDGLTDITVIILFRKTL